MKAIFKTIILSLVTVVIFLGCQSAPEKRSDEAASTIQYKYDVTDEAIIDASPSAVYNAFVDEFNGKTNWWQPRPSAKLRQGNSSDEIGAIFDISTGGLKLTAQTVEVKKNEFIRTNYIEGSFRGELLSKLEEFDGKTKISVRWQANPSGIMIRFFDLFLNIEKEHSKTMKIGSDNLNQFLKNKSSNE